MIDESRRKKRRKIADTIEVVDTMTGQVIGRLGNLSENGMLLIADAPMADDALYQLRFNLERTSGSRAIEVGAHLLWQDAASVPGHAWIGMRFITVLDDHLQQLRDWISAPGSHYE